MATSGLGLVSLVGQGINCPHCVCMCSVGFQSQLQQSQQLEAYTTRESQQQHRLSLAVICTYLAHHELESVLIIIIIIIIIIALICFRQSWRETPLL